MNSFTAQQLQSSQNRLPRREKKGADCFNLTSIVNIMDHINRSVQTDHTGLGCGCSRKKKKGFSSSPQYRSLQVGYFTDLDQDQCIICSSFFKLFITLLAVLSLTRRSLLESVFQWLNVIQQPALCLRWHALEMKCGEDSEERIPFIVYK